MTLATKKLLGKVAAGALFLSLAGVILYPRHGVKVRIHNSSSELLHGVVIHVTGNSYLLGDLRAGSTVSTQVVAKGESHVEIEFKNGRGIPKRLVVDCYFEGGGPYRGTLSVELDSEKILNVEGSITLGLF